MNPHEQIRLAALAGLLHDIGKLMLRAGAAGHRNWDAEAERDFKYKHAMLSASFVDDQVPAPWRRAVSGSAGNHHRPRPNDAMDLAVTLADILSAAERDDGTQDEDVRQRHPRQLLSIFAQLTADERRLDAEERSQAYLPLRSL
ncbi:MAG TPA: HD domain-containing protein, partial [Caldilineaceae bacterium]|nr:HD domain-containing protein [Caldilineaceae bacterium]